MIAYVDSSVLLRFVLGQPDRLSQWERIETGVTSSLTKVECLRTLDRRRVQNMLPENDFAERRALLLQVVRRLNRVEMTDPILTRAADPFPTPLGTLDAIHLATALAWRRVQECELSMVTHDLQLAMASRAMGFDVLGT